VSEVAPWWSWATHHPIARMGRRWHLSISSTLVLARSANDAGASTAAQSGRTKGWFLPVPPTLLRSYRCAVSRNERHCAASAPHSDEMKGEASPPNSTHRPPYAGGLPTMPFQLLFYPAPTSIGGIAQGKVCCIYQALAPCIETDALTHPVHRIPKRYIGDRVGKAYRPSEAGMSESLF
jgi:hypothetical protein